MVYQISPSPTTVVVTQYPTPTANPGSSIDTSNWKTYSNSTYSYSLKYPPSWTVKETNYTGYLQTTTFTANEQQFANATFLIASSPNGIGDLLKQRPNTTIAGIPAYSEPFNPNGGQNLAQNISFFSKDGKVYSLQCVHVSDHTIYLECQEMLKTLSFSQ